MTRQIGDLSWQQLSMWDFAPDNCVESYISSNGSIFHYKLVRICEIISDSHWKVEDVIDVNGVPEDIMFSRDREVHWKRGGKGVRIFKGELN